MPKAFIHRDLKPENICCAKNGELKILDLGLARNLHAELELQRYSGTPAYSSPEQCACLPTEGRSDQYSLALILFEMLTGRKVFEEIDPLELLRAHQQAACPKIRDLAAHLPDHVDRVFQKALSKSPADRYTTCSEFISELAGPLAATSTLLQTRSHWLATDRSDRIAFYLAHAPEQVPLARKLLAELTAKRYRGWLFNRDATAGTSAHKQINTAIERSQIVVAMVSRSTLRSAEFAREIEYAHCLHVPIVATLLTCRSASCKRLLQRGIVC